MHKEILTNEQWKDYVDLYFILRDHLTMKQISKKARQIFGNEYNERIFRTTLSYFKDINYAEQVTYRPGFAVDNTIIEKALLKHSLEWKP